MGNPARGDAGKAGDWQFPEIPTIDEKETRTELGQKKLWPEWMLRPR